MSAKLRRWGTCGTSTCRWISLRGGKESCTCADTVAGFQSIPPVPGGGVLDFFKGLGTPSYLPKALNGYRPGFRIGVSGIDCEGDAISKRLSLRIQGRVWRFACEGGRHIPANGPEGAVRSHCPVHLVVQKGVLSAANNTLWSSSLFRV